MSHNIATISARGTVLVPTMHLRLVTCGTGADRLQQLWREVNLWSEEEWRDVDTVSEMVALQEKLDKDYQDATGGF